MYEVELNRTIGDLVQAQLVVEESGGQFSFRHALMRDAVYSTLLVRERKKLHRAIAETLEQMQGETHIADLAYHYYEAEAWDKAAEYSMRAGEMAYSLYAPRETVEHITHALTATRQIGKPIPVVLFRLRGQAYEILGDFEHARADQEAALETAKCEEDSSAEWQALIDLGKLWAGRDYARTGEYLESALAVARSLGDPRLVAHSLNRRGNWLVNTGEGERGLQMHMEALELFQQQNDQPGAATTIDLVAMTKLLGSDLIGSKANYEKAIDLFRQLNDKFGLASSLIPYSHLSSYADTVPSPMTPADEDQRLWQQAFGITRELGWASGQAFAEWGFAARQLFRGEFDSTIQHANESLRISTAIGHRQWTVASQFQLGRCYLYMLQPELSKEYLELALKLARELGSSWWIGNIASHLATAHLLENNPARARSILEAVMPIEKEPTDLAERSLLLAWGQLAIAERDPKTALEVAARLTGSIPGGHSEQHIPLLLKLRGDALAALGRLDEAQASLMQSKEGARERSEPLIEWQVDRSLGLVYQQLQIAEKAEEAFDAARNIIQTLANNIGDTALRKSFKRAALNTLNKKKTSASRRSGAKRQEGQRSTSTRSRRASNKQPAAGKETRRRADSSG